MSNRPNSLMLSKTTPVTCVKQQKSIDIPMSKILDYLYLGKNKII